MKNKIKRFVGCLILLLLGYVLPVYSQVKALNGNKISAAQLDKFLQKEMDSIGMPGMSIAVINNGRIVYHRAVGLANMDTKVKVNEQSIFEAASLSKPVFTYLVMRMVDKGLLNLDTPLYRYMPYPDIERDPRYKLITARIVLSHRTGFPNWRYFERADSSLHVHFPDLYLKFTPGTQFAYSGEGFYYLAQVIAHLTGGTIQTLEPLYEQEVAVPLHMQHAWYTGNPYITLHKVSGHSFGAVYTANAFDNRPWPISFPTWDSTYFNPAGSLHTEAVSYARFLIGLMNGKGLSRTSLDEMLRPQIFLPKDGPFFRVYQNTAWGLGIGIAQTPYGTRYDHAGTNGNFESHAVFYKAQKYGYVFFTNCDKGDAFFNRLNVFLETGE